MMNYFSALHKYDLEIRFHRRDLYQTSAFCGHVFTMKLLLKKLTLGHMTENKCGYQMHIFVTSFTAQHAPAWRCFCMVQPLRQPFRPKCTNRILQMHQQNPVVPPESGVHPQNPVCTYSVRVHTVATDAEAPDHQYPHCRPNVCYIWAVSQKSITFIVNNIRKRNQILRKKMTQLF